MKKIILFIILFYLSFSFISGNEKDELKNYKFFKNILGEGRGNFYLKIDDEIYKNSNIFLSDIKIVDNNDQNIDYQIFKKRDKKILEEYQKKLEIVYNKNNIFIIKIEKEGEDDYIGKINLKTFSEDFSRKVEIYGSNKINGKYERLDFGDEKIFHTPAGIKLDINFKFNNYQFLKFIFKGEEGDLDVESFWVMGEKFINVEGLYKETLLKYNEKYNNGVYEYFLETPYENFPIDEIIIKAGGSFNGDIEIYSSNDKEALFLREGDKIDKNKNYWKKQFSGKIRNQVYYDDPSFEVNDNKKYYLIKIFVENNENIFIEKIIAKSYFDLIFLKRINFDNFEYKIFYGNEKVKKNNLNLLADYDLDKIKEVFLGEQKNNPIFEKKEKRKKISYIFILIFIFIIIIFWFILKIKKESRYIERKNKFINKIK